MSYPQSGYNSRMSLVSEPHHARPDAYGFEETKQATGSKWHPRNWGRKTWIGVLAAVAVVIIVVVVGAVEGTKANRYPAYKKLNYTLKDTYEGTSFFDDFDYFSGYDPAAGFVHYVDRAGSQWLNLTYASDTSAVLKVDATNADSSTGRRSVRISSKKTYNEGLFVFDILHSPYGCGTWPALWLSDPSNWPMNGEIDIVEANNAASSGNQMTLHTTNHCKMNVKRKQSGKTLENNCWNGTNSNAGCGVQGSASTYGQDLNKNGGGVYATELRSDGIRIWFFPRSSIPSDIDTSANNSTSSTVPDPSSWGEPLADFPTTDCNIGSHFRNQSIIANIDLCGQLAGLEQFYSTESHCPGTCTSFVANNYTAFQDAYWEFRSFRVYQAQG
ncbi:glycoside hydrolase family 16 protein [Xylona heveae TC161]|uniref:endo-1,3(4)-beta-glucanase n=1 Tax=Xylona heveae (strain CBS 132557 / TC161) TaxID=1328760 RepID=A0A165ABH7_XYLHT|nr:glycoside hydrolase family 16 protein [Xylona heveae TC161]KZF20212.1 glycoside hydrolase family 16 protein [Xylona heveae TC161]